MTVDLKAERARAAVRREASLLDSRARYLRDDAIRMRRRLVVEDLDELARLTWPHWNDEQLRPVVQRALEMGPAESERGEETMAQSERVRILREGIREELEKDPKLSAAAIAERLEHRGIQVPPKSTFAPYCSVARKEMGIQGAPGGRPRRNGKRPAAQPKPEMTPAPEADPSTDDATASGPGAIPGGADTHADGEPTRDRRSASDRELAEASRGDLQPRAASSAPEEAGNDATVEAPASDDPDTVEFSGGSDHFLAWRNDDGTWEIELSATLDEEQMGQVAEVMWRHVVGQPRRSAA